MNEPEALASAAPRVGFIGWGVENQAMWELLRASAGGAGEEMPFFMPGNRPGDAGPLRPLPTVEGLFAASETIMVDAPPEQVDQITPEMRLSITDRHVLVLMGEGWSMEAVWRHLNERKLVRCLISPFRDAGQPLLAFYSAPYLEPGDVAAFRALFAHLDAVLELQDEIQFLVVQGLAGIAPAAFYTILDAMADGALMMGLPRAEALRFMASLLLGAAQNMLDSGKHPALLREEALQYNLAASGLMELESAGLRGLMMRTVERAIARLDATRKED